MKKDDQKLNDLQVAVAAEGILDEASQDDELAHAGENDSAGQEALEAQAQQNDDAPLSDEAATGEIGADVNPDEGASQDAVDTQGTGDVSPLEASESGEVTDEEPEIDISSDNPNAKWYVVHTYSGHENKVSTTLMQKVASEHLEAFILDVLVPTQDKIEIRGGKKEAVKEKIFPGYILVKMVLDDNSWLAVRTTPGVTSFVGIGNKPTPIPASEVRTIVKFMTQGAAPTFKDVYMVNDTVKIIEGPFAQFIGKVDNVDKDRGKVKVLVSIFGRETPVELDFLQVQKL